MKMVHATMQSTSLQKGLKWEFLNFHYLYDRLNNKLLHMDQILKCLPVVIAIHDDITISGQDEEEHDRNMIAFILNRGL